MRKLKDYKEIIENIDPIRVVGRVKQVVGLVIESEGPKCSIGELCLIKLKEEKFIHTEAVGFKDNRLLLMPIGETDGIAVGCEVIPTGKPLTVKVGESLIGRVVNGIGEPIDDKGELKNIEAEYPIFNEPPDPLTRPRITEILPLGIKAIDSLLTVGKGQRVGIFSGSGIGKSTLLGMIARFTKADVNVIALIGERGREVRDFLERDLKEGLNRSVIVVATAHQPPLLRLRGAFVATAIAEYFRDKGHDVLLMMDSITRFARAQREIGLSIGEPPATRGFTPSVFTTLPKLLERAGKANKGSITGLYTILVEADDMNEPIADSVRAIVDGHIVLSRALANRGHFPAIDILNSVSRVMIDIVSPEQENAARKVREILATLQDAEDLINIGAYKKGSNPKIDYALEKKDTIEKFLRQEINQKAEYSSSVETLIKIFKDDKEV